LMKMETNMKTNKGMDKEREDSSQTASP
jgi:hypothetical protein